MKKLLSFMCAALLCASTLPVLAASSSDNNHPPQGKRHAPPPEALEACKGLTENTTCQFNGRDNELVSGVCSSRPKKLSTNATSSDSDGTAVLACHPKRGPRDDHPAKDDATN